MTTNLIGKSIDRYHILEQLGEGGMATVYKAYDTRLERDVAIKIIRTDLFGASVLERMLKRFEREAKSLAKLSHLHIIKVIDYGEYQGSPYLVMEYMPGGTLKDKLKGKPMDWQEAVKLLLPVAEALEYAHEQKIIHRDIKPSNILLTNKGQPMLTDFGIAKMLETEETFTLTGTGIGVGTPEYMAPEQWTGSATAQSDIYSLGVVLYEMVTGRKPYTADTPAAILLKQATEPLPRPSAHVRDLPDSIEKILLKALARNPKDRYQDAGVLTDKLEDTLAGTSKAKKTIATPKKSGLKKLDSDTQDTYLQDETYSTNVQHTTLEDMPRKDHAIKKKWRGSLFIVAIIIFSMLFVGEKLIGLINPPDLPQSSTQTPIPAYIPVLDGTPYLAPATQISTDNAQRLSQLMQYGKGALGDVDYSPNGYSIAVATSTGVYILDANTLDIVNFIKTDSWTDYIAFSSDGNMLASISDDGLIMLWEVSTWKLLRTIETYHIYPNDITFNPDNTILISSSYDGGTHLWKISNGELLDEYHGNHSVGVAISPDNQFMAKGEGCGFELMQLNNSSIVFDLFEQHDYCDSINALEFSPEGNLLVTGGGKEEEIVRIWSVPDGRLLNTLEGHTSSVRELAISPDGRFIASGSADNTVKIWRVNDGLEIFTLKGHTSGISCLSFSPDGKYLISGSSELGSSPSREGEGMLIKWNIKDGSRINTVNGFKESEHIYPLALSPNRQSLASGSANGDVMLWTNLEYEDKPIILSDQDDENEIEALIFSPDGKFLASGNLSGRIILWDTLSGNKKMDVKSPGPFAINSLDFSPNGLLLAEGNNDSFARLWSVPDGKLIRTLESEGADRVSFSPDGTLLVTNSYGYFPDKYFFRLWMVSDGSLFDTINTIFPVFKPGGSLFATTTNTTTYFWETSNGELLYSFGEGGNELLFSPNGMILAVQSGDNINLLDSNNGALLRRLVGHQDSVRSMMFNSEGTLLLSGSDDSTIRIWNVTNGTLIDTLYGHTGEIFFVAFANNEKLIISGSSDGTIRFWGVAP
jgi:WD40 repeat protein/serine/threonine protein kinase